MKKELIIGRGEEAQQSQIITDTSVSRKHLILTESSDGKNRAYHIRLANLQNLLYVNGLKMVECDIDENDKIQLGKNKFVLDVKQAIADIRNLTSTAERNTELPTQIPNQQEKTEEPILQQPQIKGIINHKKWFKLMNFVLVLLLLLSVLFRRHQPLYTIILLMLVGAILFDIYLFTKKER